MDTHPDHRWVAARLAVTTPTWEADPHRAVLGPGAAPALRVRPGLRLAAAAVTVAALVVLVPAGRAVGQELWYRLFVSRLEVVRLDLSRVPLETSIQLNGPQQPAASVQDASRMAGYTVRLPPADVLPGVPALHVMPPIALRQTIRTGPLAAALAAAGATDVEVPGEWDGVSLRATIGQTVVAVYRDPTAPPVEPGGAPSARDEVEILQTPPIRLDLPAGFALDRFAEAVFRAGGLSWWQARTLGQEYAAHPAWLLDVKDDAAVTVETVPLAGGTAIVIGEAAAGGGEETTVFVSRPGRLYAVSSLSRGTSLRVAESLP
jgi:hypothetical protein